MATLSTSAIPTTSAGDPGEEPEVAAVEREAAGRACLRDERVHDRARAGAASRARRRRRSPVVTPTAASDRHSRRTYGTRSRAPGLIDDHRRLRARCASSRIRAARAVPRVLARRRARVLPLRAAPAAARPPPAPARPLGERARIPRRDEHRVLVPDHLADARRSRRRRPRGPPRGTRRASAGRSSPAHPRRTAPGRWTRSRAAAALPRAAPRPSPPRLQPRAPRPSWAVPDHEQRRRVLPEQAPALGEHVRRRATGGASRRRRSAALPRRAARGSARDRPRSGRPRRAPRLAPARTAPADR